MKTYVPTITVIFTLAFASSINCAQIPPATTAAPVAVTVAASPNDEVAIATENTFEAQNEALAKVDEKLLKLGRSGRSSTSTRSLVVPRDATDAKNLSETEEDMSVMARILEKAASGKSEKGERQTGFVWGFASTPATAKNLFIDGHGALFFVNVDFPLLPPESKEKVAEPKSETDSEWEKTKNELLHPQGTSSDFSYKFELFDSTGPFATSGVAEEYDEEKVTELKENLSAALKNASHIRRLKGDDTVTVVVTGRSSNPGLKAATTRKSQNVYSGSSGLATTWVTTPRSGSQTPAPRLIIRAKRPDIESFQKDKLSADDFRKKVTMFTY